MSATWNVYTVLSLTSAPPLISTRPPLKINLFISLHQQKPLLFYKMPEILVKLDILFMKKLANGGKTLQKMPEKHCSEKSANFYFNVMSAHKSNFQNAWGTNKG